MTEVTNSESALNIEISGVTLEVKDKEIDAPELTPLEKYAEKSNFSIDQLSELFSGAPFPRVYTLFYRYNTTPPLTKGFWFDGPLSAAIAEGRRHCDIMKCRFICVRPLIVSLSIQEEDKAKDSSYDEDRKFA